MFDIGGFLLVVLDSEIPLYLSFTDNEFFRYLDVSPVWEEWTLSIITPNV